MILGVVDYTVRKYIRQLQVEFSKYDSVSERIRFVIAWYTEIDSFDLKWFLNLSEFRSLGRTNRKVAEALKQFFLSGKKLLVEHLEEGIASGELRNIDASTVANLIFGSLEGAVSLWLIDPDSTDLESMGREMQNMFLQYLQNKQAH